MAGCFTLVSRFLIDRGNIPQTWKATITDNDNGSLRKKDWWRYLWAPSQCLSITWFWRTCMWKGSLSRLKGILRVSCYYNYYCYYCYFYYCYYFDYFAFVVVAVAAVWGQLRCAFTSVAFVEQMLFFSVLKGNRIRGCLYTTLLL